MTPGQPTFLSAATQGFSTRCHLGLAMLALAWAATTHAQAPATILSRIEPGLEEAVKWKWRVESAGLPAQSSQNPSPTLAEAMRKPETPRAGEDGTYTVRKGDVLVRIARRHNITVEQLKAANDLKSDLIRPGDVLRIPSLEELAARATPSPPPTGPSPPTALGPVVADFDPEVLLLQVYLDRLGFSPGPIDGVSGLRFQKLMFTFLTAHGGDLSSLVEKARADLPQPLTTYTLRPEDFAYIRIPKPPARSSSKTSPEEKNREAYHSLISQPELLYRSAWEFVAERFHCDEAFLRQLNPTVKNQPEAGAVFRVPQVIAFEIEKAFEEPLRPPPEPEHPVKAIIADLSRMEIFRGEEMVASFPVSVVRPGLRGRGEWVILDSLPRPRLLTRREPRVERTLPGGEGEPIRAAVLAQEEALGPGPRNPVGLLWIDLAKAEDRQPLPFGLHGTSVPGRMYVTESLGGFRMTNWDIFRAARLLPVGTPLRWRATLARKTPALQPGETEAAPLVVTPALPASSPATPAQP